MAGRPLAHDVIVLAAGRSSRMGQPKGLVLVDGRPWIERQLAALAGHRVVLVLGADRDLYLRALPELERRAVLVVNPAPERGPFASLQEGLAAATPDQPVFVLPVDVPAAAPSVWAALAEALSLRAGIAAAVPCHADRGGHPVLLAPSLVTHLRSRRSPEVSRLDQELRSLPAGALARVPVDDPRVRLNLNAPEDWGKVAKGG